MQAIDRQLFFNRMANVSCTDQTFNRITILYIRTKRDVNFTTFQMIKYIHKHIKTVFVQETRHKNQGLFKDFPAPNYFFPGPFFFN